MYLLQVLIDSLRYHSIFVDNVKLLITFGLVDYKTPYYPCNSILVYLCVIQYTYSQHEDGIFLTESATAKRSRRAAANENRGKSLRATALIRFSRRRYNNYFFSLFKVTYRSKRIEDRIEIEEQKSNNTSQVEVSHFFYIEFQNPIGSC